MAKKKSKLKKLPVKPLSKNKWLRKVSPLILVMLGVLAGLIVAWLQPPSVNPKNLVWAADNTIMVPNDLAAFLYSQDNCKSYRGKDSPRGVGLWGVYQTSQNKFAKVSYGCSTDLTLYMMAVKEGGKWQLLPSTEYFANRPGAVNSYLPKCTLVDRYQIDKSIEPFCLEDSGAARENQLDAK